MDVSTIAKKFANLYEKKIGYKLEDKKEFVIVRNILTKYGLPTNNFDDNLGSLIISDKHTLTKSRIEESKYSAKSNTIDLPKKREDFIHELFHMASSNSKNNSSYMGSIMLYNNKITGESLNEGIVDYFTSLAVPEYKVKYPVQVFFAKYISKVFGMSIFKEFFNGNANKFYTSFRQYINKIIPFTEYLDQIQKLTQECLEADDYFDEIDNKANELVELLKKCINEFVKILQSKNIDVDEFLDEFSEMLNDKNNYFVTSFNLFFDHSSYRSKENFFETMKLEKKEKGIKL